MRITDNRKKPSFRNIELLVDGECFEYTSPAGPGIYVKTNGVTSMEVICFNLRTAVTAYILKSAMVYPLDVEIVIH